MKSKFILGFILSLSALIPGYGQAIEDIEQQVKSELESKYGISFLVDVDAFDGGDAYTYQDPYNTLSRSYLIMASGLESDKDLIGVYKDGALLWTTEPELISSTYRHFLGSRELNSDGKVELIIGWKLGVNPRGSFLWIISWDGSTGQIINKTDERDRPEVYSGGDVIFFPDFEGDGIYEIMTYDFYDGDEDDSNDLYFLLKWDGSNYSLYQKLQQKDLLLSQFDRKGFKVDVNAQVKKTPGNNLFQYDIFNEANSLKKIEHIHLASNISNFRSISIPHDRDLFDSRYGFITLFAEGLDKEKSSLVPGDSLSFSFSTKSLVKISNYYLQSFNDVPPSASLNASDEERIADIKTNSVSGYTLGPWLPDSSLSFIDLTDTLETFRFRSCEELDWATDAGVCGELDDDLSEVRSNLLAGDSLAAANALQAFIELVEQEKDVSLTSEGYALLYYNAQYLAERLPEPQEPDPGSGITCGCDNPVTQASGTITIRNDETRCLNTPFSGAVFFESGGTLNVCSTATLQNIYGNQPGRINVSEAGEVTVGNWNNNFSGDAFTNWGTTIFTGWTTINNGSLTNHGEMSVGGGLNQNNGQLVNTGELTVTNAATFNQPGNRNEGSFSARSLSLNSNAEIVNECRVETSGRIMINGTLYSQAGSFVSAGGQLTINSGGVLAMQGGQAMTQVNGVMLNGTIESVGVNLLVSEGAFRFNSGATISTGPEPFYLKAPNLGEVSSSFNVSDGSAFSIPSSSCNPNGYNSGQ